MGRCDKSIPTRFLAPIECLKIPAQATYAGGIDPLESILGLLKSLKIRALFGSPFSPVNWNSQALPATQREGRVRESTGVGSHTDP